MEVNFEFTIGNAIIERLRCLSQPEKEGYHMVMEIKGSRQGAIKGEDLTSRLPILGFEWGVSTTSAAAADQKTGRRSYRPLYVTRRCDAATASIMSGLASNEEMTVSISVFEANTDLLPVWQLTLKKARLIEHLTHTGGAIGGVQEVLAIAGGQFELQTAAQLVSGIRGGVRVFSDSVVA